MPRPSWREGNMGLDRIHAGSGKQCLESNHRSRLGGTVSLKPGFLGAARIETFMNGHEVVR